MTRAAHWAVVFGVLGCGSLADGTAEDTGERPDEPEPRVETRLEFDGSIDCVGMTTSGLSSWTVAVTRTPLLGTEITVDPQFAHWSGAESQARCALAIFNVSPGGTARLVPYDGHNLVTGLTDVAFLGVVIEGKQYFASDGELVVDEATRVDDSRNGLFTSGRGSYTATFELDDGRVAEVRGQWEFCDYGIRLDCPYNAVGGLQKKGRISTMSIFDADFEPTYCQVIVDDQTGAVQLDMEIGIFRGLPITQMVSQCAPHDNHFSFRSGGWNGPGRYGPFKAVPMGPDGMRLPDVTWHFSPAFSDVFRPDQPATFCLWKDEFINGPEGGLRYWAELLEDATCEYTIEESPDHVELECQRFWHYSDAFPSYAQFLAGSSELAPLQLSVDCDVVHKNAG